jgi:AcrR family transcriptional regulator
MPLPQTTDQTPASRRNGPGRPRSAKAEAAILNATLELMAQYGLEGLSMEAVAARAHVSKATIYRRWPSRKDMVAAALRSLTSEIEVPDTGDVRDDLVGLLRAFQAATLHSLPETLRPRLIALTLTDPDLMQIFLTNVYLPRRAALLDVLERGKSRGELRADLDTDLAGMMIHGPMFQLSLLGKTEALQDPETPARLVDAVLAGIGTRD